MNKNLLDLLKLKNSNDNLNKFISKQRGYDCKVLDFRLHLNPSIVEFHICFANAGEFCCEDIRLPFALVEENLEYILEV